MAGAKVVPLSRGGQDERRKVDGKLFVESPHDHLPIWVHMKDREQMRSVFRSLFEELNAAGHSCAGDTQSDPHSRLAIIDFFEVFMHVPDKHAPENLGIVTLYADSEGRELMKINPSFPAACHIFRSCLSRALERSIMSGAAGGGADMEVTIRQESDFEAA